MRRRPGARTPILRGLELRAEIGWPQPEAHQSFIEVEALGEHPRLQSLTAEVVPPWEAVLGGSPTEHHDPMNLRAVTEMCVCVAAETRVVLEDLSHQRAEHVEHQTTGWHGRAPIRDPELRTPLQLPGPRLSQP